jgi:hypothetical protein
VYVSNPQESISSQLQPVVTNTPTFESDRERMTNLNYIYKNIDVEAIIMLQMRRAPLKHLVKRFRVRGYFKVASTHVSNSNWQCSLMLLDITIDF